MNISKWTRVLIGTGIISLPAALQADNTATNTPAPPSPTVLTALSSTTLSGYIDTTAIWKFGTGNANMPDRVYDKGDVQDGFDLNVVSLTLNKPLDDSAWAAGYNVQMLMGPGAAKRGTGLFASSTTTEFSFNEAYVNLHIPVGNGIELHVGQFGTFNGYEVYDTYKNPNWSRSLGFDIESSAHTGLAATYKINDLLTLMAGVGNAAGFNNQVDARQAYESKKAYLGMLTFTAPDNWGWMKGASVSAGYTVGDHQLDATGNTSTYTPAGGARFNQGNIYIGGSTPTPLTGLTVGFAYDYTYGITAKSDYANATAIYLLYAVDKWKFNNRFDYGSSSPSIFDGIPSPAPDRIFAYTLDVDYSLWKNVVSRAEFRWDHSLAADRPFGGTIPGPIQNEKNAASIGMNIIYMF